MNAKTTPQPGDLDRMRFAIHEAHDISTTGLIRAAGIGTYRGRMALDELLACGEVTNSVGHHHGDGDLCCCKAGERAQLPRLTHWYPKKNRLGT